MNETREIIKKSCQFNQQTGNGDTIRRKSSNVSPIKDDFGLSKERTWTLTQKHIVRLTKALSIIHHHMVGVEMSYQRDVVNLQKLYYNTYYRPLQELRRTLLAAISREYSQPTKQDIEELVRNTNLFPPKSSSYNDLINHCQTLASGGHHLVAANFAKNFWLRVFWKSDSIVSNMVRKKEARLLKYLVDLNYDLINFSKGKDGQKNGTTHGFRICFKFARTNPYFYNRRIWKRYVVDIHTSERSRVGQTEKSKEDTKLSESEELVSYEGPRIVEVSGTKLIWKHNSKARRFKKKDGKYPANSLIGYLQFGWNEKSAENHQEAELDYMIGNYIRMNLLPNAYGIFKKSDVISTQPTGPKTSEEQSLKPQSSAGTINVEMEDMSLGADHNCTNTMEQYSEVSSSAGNRSVWTEVGSNRSLLSLMASNSDHRLSDYSVSELSESPQIHDDHSERDENETINTQLSMKMSDIEDVLGVAIDPSPKLIKEGDQTLFPASRNFKRLRKSSSDLGQSSMYDPKDPVVRTVSSMSCSSLDYDKEVEMLTKDMDQEYKNDVNCITPSTLNSPMCSDGSSLFDATESHQSQIDQSNFDEEMSREVHFAGASTAPARIKTKQDKSKSKIQKLKSSKQSEKKHKSKFSSGHKAKVFHQKEAASGDEYARFDNASTNHSITLSTLRNKLVGHTTIKRPRESTPSSVIQHYFNIPDTKASNKRKKKYKPPETTPESDASCTSNSINEQEVSNKPQKTAVCNNTKLMFEHPKKDRTTYQLTGRPRDKRTEKPEKKRVKYLLKQKDYDVFDEELFYPPKSLVYESSSDMSDMGIQAMRDHFLGDDYEEPCRSDGKVEDLNNAENKRSYMMKIRKSPFDPKPLNIGVSVPADRKETDAATDTHNYALHPSAAKASDISLSDSIGKNSDKEDDSVEHHIDGKRGEEHVSSSSSSSLESEGFLPSLQKLLSFRGYKRPKEKTEKSDNERVNEDYSEDSR